MEKIKLFTDLEAVRLNRADIYRSVSVAEKVRDFLKELGITPTPGKIVDFIVDEGKSIINEINSFLEDDLKTVKSEITRNRIKQDTSNIITMIKGFIENASDFDLFVENSDLIRIKLDTLEVIPVAGYDKIIGERHTKYVSNFEKYGEFQSVCNQINRLLEKYNISFSQSFEIVHGRAVPHPLGNY